MRASLRNFAAIFLLGIAAFLASQNGVFMGIDNTFKEWRFANHNVPATGEVVFVDIDARSLQDVGHWPWPRWVYAGVLDKLTEYNAYDVAFDVDFSSRSIEENDREFADALERAGGFTYLAALQQLSLTANGKAELITNRPLDIFREHSELALVNVETQADGLVWQFSKYGRFDEEVVPSLPTIFAPKIETKRQNNYFIDYSIDLFSIDRVSVIDLLNGDVEASRIDGKKVIVGASALELGDLLEVPSYGRIPGPLVQVLATETRLQNRELFSLPPLVPWFVFIATAFLVSRWKRVSVTYMAIGFVSLAVGLEFIAFLLQSKLGLYSETFWFHVALLLTYALKIFDAMDIQRLLVHRVAGENIRMQTILDRIITDNFDGVVIIDSEHNILAASEPAEEMFGNRNLVGTSSAALPDFFCQQINGAFELAAQGIEQPKEAEVHVLRHDDEGNPELVIEYSMTVSSVKRYKENAGKEVDEFVACFTFREITHRFMHERRMDYLANHDLLTGAYTRTRLVEEVSSFIGDEGASRQPMMLILLDLDRFKNINETLGHSAGDMLLKAVAGRLGEFGLYSVARLGADRFAAAKPGVMTWEDAQAFAARLEDHITAPYELDGHRALIGVSVGMTDTDNSGYSPDALISHADMALSEAKDIPGNSHFLFRPELNNRILERQRIEMSLLDAVERDEFHLAYQPQVCLTSGELLGAEALVRWKSPELGAVRPDRFISVAEDSGMIIEIGRWVLIQACKDAMKWPKSGKLAVNVSAVQFAYGDIVQTIKDALEISQLPVERLDIEITESVFVTKQDKFIQTLNEIVEMGVGVALDDFGTGYSSLSYLSRLPVDKVKIDQSFVRNLPEDEQSMAIVQSVLSLSSAMDKRVVAEGVETRDQAWVLRLAGCGIGQGYLFGRPQSHEDFCLLLDRDEYMDFSVKKAG